MENFWLIAFYCNTTGRANGTLEFTVAVAPRLSRPRGTGSAAVFPALKLLPDGRTGMSPGRHA
jgi:hypothetical protein